MNSSNFSRRKKSKEAFVSGGVEIEDTHTLQAQAEEESVRMQIILTKSQRAWLRRTAYETDTQMSKVIRSLINEAMLAED